MGSYRALSLATALLVGTACGGSASPDRAPTPEHPTADGVTACLEARGISVRERRSPSYATASDELIVGERRRAGARIGVGVLFFATDADVQEAVVTSRIVADPVEFIGRVMIVPAGPGFDEVEQALLDCLG